MLKVFFTKQFVKFLGVGGIAALSNWLARAVFSIWFSFGVAVTLAYAIGMMTAFLLNKRFVFPYANRPLAKQARDFVATNIAFFPVVWGIALELHRLFETLGFSFYPAEIAHAIAIAAPMFLTFLIYKFVAFRTDIT